MAAAHDVSVNEVSDKSVIFQADGEVIDVSDSESNASVVVGGGVGVVQEAPIFARLTEGEKVRNVMESKFLRDMEPIGLKPEVVAVHRNACKSLMAVAKAQTFQIFHRAVAKMRDGNANIVYAWYGASSKGELREIVEHGFTGNNLNNGLRLSPESYPIESVKKCVADRHGIKHMLLCRVILGRLELVQPDQWRPSSPDFDSGAVESLADPKEYVIWSSRMNTHILPEFVLSFKLPPVPGRERVEQPLRPSSPWMPFPALIAVLSRTLPSPDVTLLKKYHIDYAEKRISRLELIQKVRTIAGDPLLVAIIKTFRAKKIPPSCLKMTKSRNGNRTGSKGAE
ncbi:hypothetical protein RIF29_06935 [Crotalaria pallida]|uniref:Uncharacterized protein n=1 Tax=Crotalaria pallida TaxID=3830 RepID=A0AAN9J4T4_CROPI